VKIGDIDVIAVNDGEGKLSRDYIPSLDWDTHASLLDGEGNFPIALGCFLIKTKDRNVLVDAGLGPVTFPPFRGGDLPANLAEAGVTPDDIDIIVLTHLHIDHIGWLAQNGAPYFPNAAIRFGAKDLDQFIHAENPDQFTKPVYDVIEPTGRIETITGDENIAPGVDVLQTPGHTLGHISVVVSSGEQRAFLLGDAMACPAQLEDAEWAAMSDIDPKLSTRSREALYKEMESPGAVAVASHFPDLKFGRVLQGKGKRYFG
jgi:glyoxylase-like metal-dependent hydrolase (beta-lactamase superfamily II)